MAARPGRGAFLRPLPDPLLPARHSPGARRRAVQLQAFLRGLQRTGAAHLEPRRAPELLVVARPDWRRMFSYPYGLPFTRTRADGISIVVAADYPGRLLHRFDALLLRAGHAGLRPPGDLREFLDLLVGHEWGHALANGAELRSRVRWLDELMATYLFLLSLHEGGDEAVAERFLEWTQWVLAGSARSRSDLGAFELPRTRLSLEEELWFQAVFSRRAAALLPHGWELPHRLRNALPADRGVVARLLLDLEPSFKPWFATFAPSQRAEGAERARGVGEDAS